jgi:hypothetical protein
MMREIYTSVEAQRHDCSPLESAVQMLAQHRHTLAKVADQARKQAPASEATRQAEQNLQSFDAKVCNWIGST